MPTQYGIEPATLRSLARRSNQLRYPAEVNRQHFSHSIKPVVQTANIWNQVSVKTCCFHYQLLRNSLSFN